MSHVFRLLCVIKKLITVIDKMKSKNNDLGLKYSIFFFGVGA